MPAIIHLLLFGGMVSNLTIKRVQIMLDMHIHLTYIQVTELEAKFQRMLKLVRAASQRIANIQAEWAGKETIEI